MLLSGIIKLADSRLKSCGNDLFIAGLFFLIFLAAGCGQKKEAEVPAAVSAPQIPAALPELEQNKIFERSQPRITPNFSFQPMPDEQEPAPPEKFPSVD